MGRVEVIGTGVLSLACVLAAPICGVFAANSGAGSGAVRKATSEYLAALGSEEGKRICPLHTRKAQEWLVSEAQKYDKQVTDCVAAADILYPGSGRYFAKAEILSVRVLGRRARVTVRYPGAKRSRIPLRRIGDRWLVDV